MYLTLNANYRNIMDAHGMAANVRKIKIIKARKIPVAQTISVPTTGIIFKARANAPSNIVGATSGTTKRLASGAIKESWPKAKIEYGKVANIAPRVSERRDAVRRITGTRSKNFWIDGESQINPAVAKKDRAKEASAKRMLGSKAVITAAEISNNRGAAAWRPIQPAMTVSPPITAARTTDAEPPVKIVKAQRKMMMSGTEIFFLIKAARARPMRPTIIKVTLNPETATI